MKPILNTIKRWPKPWPKKRIIKMPKNNQTAAVAAAAATAAIMTTDIKYIQEDVACLQRDVKAIMENHIPHLETEIEKLSTKITLFTAINIGGIILGIIATQILK
jgi:hypothetical protein